MTHAAVCDGVRRLIHVMFLDLWATLALDTRRAASSLSRSYTCAVTLDTAVWPMTFFRSSSGAPARCPSVFPPARRSRFQPWLGCQTPSRTCAIDHGNTIAGRVGQYWGSL